MKEVSVGLINEYRDHLSWVETLRERDLLIFDIDFQSLGLCTYEAILYEYSKSAIKPMKRWKHTGNWKRGYQISFDMYTDYRIKEGVKYLLTYVFLIQKHIEVRYHVFIEL